MEADYRSGDDYEVEFLEHRFSFGREDFEERVVAAAVKLGLVKRGELDGDETADLVELTADGQLAIPRTTSFVTGSGSPSSAMSRSCTGYGGSSSGAPGSIIA
jgi:hypothetical protein